MHIRNEEVLKVMAETGMGELQAYRHLQCRQMLTRRNVRQFRDRRI